MTEEADLEALARRTLDLMQDQVSAMASDRQTTEQMQRWLQAVLQVSGPTAAAQMMAGSMSANALAGWAGLWQQGLAGMAGAAGRPPADDGRRGDAGSSGTAGSGEGEAAGRSASPGAAPAAAAPGDGGPGLERLEARVAELEARLAELGGGQQSGDRKPRRKPGAGSRKRSG
jgi:hypothetical protein